MELNLTRQAAGYRQQHKRTSIWKKITMVLASVVVFCTTYALILPAITMEQDVVCGLDEHIHAESCYTAAPSVAVTELFCDSDSLALHSHDETCLDENGLAACGYADFVLHRHDAVCYDSDGQLQCVLPEIDAHVHGAICWQQPHVHGETCYTTIQGELLCTVAEGETHAHGETCYTPRQNLICTQPEVVGHAHSESCRTMTTTLVCKLTEEEAHAHDETCLDETGALACAKTETAGHIHDETCRETAEIMTCTLPEQAGHSHGEGCYETVYDLSCDLSDAQPHAHADGCYQWTPQLICKELTAEEGAQPTLICRLEEIAAHTHDEACFADGILTCGKTEVLAHVHQADDCYQVSIQDSQQQVVSCGQEEHTHVETCYPAQEETDGELSDGDGLADIRYCGIADHSHVGVCYGADGILMCTMTEHEHDWLCDLAPSDHTAVETQEDWEADLPALTGDIASDLIAVAESQLGYEENTANYIITEDDELLYYSRYADWWSDGEELYGDWNAKFVAFCLKYAEAGMELYDDPALWATDLSTTDLWLRADNTPVVSDLVFFDNDGDGTADRVGVVTAVDDETFAAILERRGMVQKVTYDLDDSDILGYGMVTGEVFDPTFDPMVERVNTMIEALPTSEEADAVLLAYEDAGDMEGYEAYFRELAEMAERAYAIYEVMTEEQIAAVVDAEKMLDLGWTWQMRLFAVTDSVPVYGVNAYASKMIVRPGTDAASVDSGTGFAWWTAVVVEEDSNGKLYVAQIYADHSNDAVKTHLSATTANGFVLFTHDYIPNASRGDLVTVSFDYKNTNGATTSSFGVVRFGSNGTMKPAKDNSDKLNIVDGADTDELIEVNLYNYGSNINTLYSSNNKYPGFQQEGGESSGANLQSSNFGNNVTEDRDAGINGLTNKGGDINATNNSANSPISGAILGTLKDGYPALADGTSLDYLFRNSTYADKQNTQSINGLFQYNEVTGEYTFNSRENHAQYSNNRFTLYEEIITPNFTMYPFGNFLPFSDIVHDSAQVSTMNRNYLSEIQSSAQYKADAGYDNDFTTVTPYATLASSMKTWISTMDTKYGSTWNIANGANEYFAYITAIPDLDFNQNPALLNKAYCIDYDEPKNFYFGMEMKMNFMMPKNGMTGNDTNGDGKSDYPMVFEFSGDDDVWVYVDDILFLDLSGIHRHVGGTIDFSRGIVTYQALDPATGDVGAPYKTVTFAEILGSTTDLNANGTFKDYSQHTFNFYYMERGAGSGVCRMNFNFPLLRKNSINVTKKNTANVDVSGSPDYYFNLMAEHDSGRTTGLFVGPDSTTGITQYTVMDSSGNIIQENGRDKIYTIGADGIFKIKAGQTAVFEGVPENAGKFYVQELIPEADVPQYGGDTSSTTTATGDVYVNGTTARYRQLIDWSERTYFSQYDTDGNPETGPLGYRWWGYSGPAADSSTNSSFYFEQDNHVSTAALGSLEISKKLIVNRTETDVQLMALRTPEFTFYVTLDGAPLPTGSAYKVNGVNKTVTTAGYITVPAGQTAVIDHILSGSKYTVKEVDAQSYDVTYSTTNGSYNSTTGQVEGTITTGTAVEVSVINSIGAAGLEIPVQKTLPATDGTARAFTFLLQQVTDKTDPTPVGAAQSLTLAFSETDLSGAGSFTLTYADIEATQLPVTYYYQLTEQPGEDTSVIYDPTVYLIEVQIDSNGTAEQNAAVTGFWVQSGTDWVERETHSADFTNIIVGELKLSKTVVGSAANDGFRFLVTLTPGTSGVPIAEKYPVVVVQQTGEVDTGYPEWAFTNGTAVFTDFKSGESVTIQNIPIGTQWTITEDSESADGYNTPTYTVTQGGKEASGEDWTSSDVISAGKTDVVYTNTIGYELPETGGGGIAKILTCGGLLAIMPYLWLLRRQRYRGRRVTGG